MKKINEYNCDKEAKLLLDEILYKNSLDVYTHSRFQNWKLHHNIKSKYFTINSQIIGLNKNVNIYVQIFDFDNIEQQKKYKIDFVNNGFSKLDNNISVIGFSVNSKILKEELIAEITYKLQLYKFINENLQFNIKDKVIYYCSKNCSENKVILEKIKHIALKMSKRCLSDYLRQIDSLLREAIILKSKFYVCNIIGIIDNYIKIYEEINGASIIDNLAANTKNNNCGTEFYNHLCAFQYFINYYAQIVKYIYEEQSKRDENDYYHEIMFQPTSLFLKELNLGDFNEK